MDFKRIKISTTVPLKNADQLRNALGEAGAGKISEYSFCSFSVIGKGRSTPNNNANPHIGEANKLADDILAAQSKEIDMMQTWQTGWGYKIAPSIESREVMH